MGPLAAGIPGEPAAFDYLARKFGKLPLKVSLQPAIRLAREGFPLYARLQGAISYKRERLVRSPDAAKVFLTADGQVPELGAIIKQPELAATLEALADKGSSGFYSGRVAQDLVNGVRAGGGIWTLKDLADYRVIERKPLIGEYRGARIVSASPPSSGGVALLDALNILSGVDLNSIDSATRKHWIISAMQRAYRDRAVYLGDPDFVKMPVAQLISKDYASVLRVDICAFHHYLDDRPPIGGKTIVHGFGGRVILRGLQSHIGLQAILVLILLEHAIEGATHRIVVHIGAGPQVGIVAELFQLHPGIAGERNFPDTRPGTGSDSERNIGKLLLRMRSDSLHDCRLMIAILLERLPHLVYSPDHLCLG